MTNEQAAEILEEVKVIDDGLGQYIPGFDEALDLAISNLRSGRMTVEEAVDALGEEPLLYLDDDYYLGKRNQWREDVAALKLASSKHSSEHISKLMQEIFSKTLILESTTGELHEVIHTDDLKDIFREVVGWTI